MNMKIGHAPILLPAPDMNTRCPVIGGTDNSWQTKPVGAIC